MSKLITKYQNDPSIVNRVKLLDYLRKHPMAVCMATAEELQFLRFNDFIAE